MILGKNFIEKKESLSKEIDIQTHLINVDSVLIGSTDIKGGPIFKYQPSTDKLNFWDYYPNNVDYEQLNTTEKYVLYARSWVYNKDKKILAGCYYSYFNQVNFFNLDGDCLKSIKFPTLDYKFDTKTVLFDSPIYATSAIGTANNIYITYKSGKEMIEEDIKGMINVLNWEGIPVKQYLIKNVNIGSFAIDEINNKVYGYAPENEESSIVEFDL